MLEVLEPRHELRDAGLGLSIVVEGLLGVGKSDMFAAGIFGTGTNDLCSNMNKIGVWSFGRSKNNNLNVFLFYFVDCKKHLQRRPRLFE
jgi:hypothetical protein